MQPQVVNLGLMVLPGVIGPFRSQMSHRHVGQFQEINEHPAARHHRFGRRGFADPPITFVGRPVELDVPCRGAMGVDGDFVPWRPPVRPGLRPPAFNDPGRRSILLSDCSQRVAIPLSFSAVLVLRSPRLDQPARRREQRRPGEDDDCDVSGAQASNVQRCSGMSFPGSQQNRAEGGLGPTSSGGSLATDPDRN
jgi:hypothetical protein